MQKFKDICIKYKMFLGLGVITMLLFFCNIWFPMWIISGAVIILFMITCNISEIFAVIMYLELYTGLYGQYVIGIGAGLLIMIVRYIIDVKKGRKKFYKIPFILTTLICIIWSAIKFSYDTFAIYSGAYFIYIFYLIYFVYVYYREIDIAKCFNYLLAGMIVTSALALIGNQIPNFGISFYSSDGLYYRLRLFTMHMNFLSMLCLFQIVYSIYSMFYKKRELHIDLIAIFVSTVLGLLTLSKAFTLMLIFFIIYSVICLIIKYRKKSIKYIAIIVGVFGFLSIFFHSYIIDVFERFYVHVDFGNSLISKITTGRSGIWYMYLDEIGSSPLNLLFGAGLFSNNLHDVSPHNVAIFLLYRFGIVGILALVTLFASYIKLGKPWYKIRLDNCLMCLTWFILSFEEVVLSDKYLFFLIFGIIMMMKEQVDQKAYDEAVLQEKPELGDENLANVETETVSKSEDLDDKSEALEKTKQKIETKDKKTEVKKYTVKSKKSLNNKN